MSRSFAGLPAWDSLAEALRGSGVDGGALAALNTAMLEAVDHGDLPQWLAAIEDFPAIEAAQALDVPAPRLGLPVEGAPEDQGQEPPAEANGHSRESTEAAGAFDRLRNALMALHPWRKGPLCLGGVPIDTEWRSDFKWARIAPHIDLAGATVLDVGCGNGYFGWRMLGAGARCVVGIDPTVLFVAQWLAQVRCAGPSPNFVLPLRDTDLPLDIGGFDAVFSLGVLYHRRDPMDHLARLWAWTRPGGQLVLETLVVEGPRSLHPEGRYARMRNVHEVPTVDHLLERVRSAGFTRAQVADLNRTTTREQRSTDWMRFESLDRCLDPDDPARTVEGHPAPLRAIVTARRPMT